MSKILIGNYLFGISFELRLGMTNMLAIAFVIDGTGIENGRIMMLSDEFCLNDLRPSTHGIFTPTAITLYLDTNGLRQFAKLLDCASPEQLFQRGG